MLNCTESDFGVVLQAEIKPNRTGRLIDQELIELGHRNDDGYSLRHKSVPHPWLEVG